MKLTTPKIAQLTNFFSSNFLKSSLSDQQVSRMLQNAQLLEPILNTEIFHQGDPIQQYYFIITGIVQLHKNINKINNSYREVILLEGGQVAGEYFTSLNNVREYTAEVKVECTQVVKIQKQYFDSLCLSLVSQYRQADRYAHQVLQLSKKINSFDIFIVKAYRLGSHINLNSNEIGVIFNGQCKILYKPDRNPRKCSLPVILKPRYKTTLKQIALISQGQWIFTQHLEQQPIEKPEKFIYLVTSQVTTLLIMQTSKIDVLPRNTVEILYQLRSNRKNMLNTSRQTTTNQNEMHSLLKSPLQVKYSIDWLRKVLQKLDPNSSPNFVLQQCKYGHHCIKSNRQYHKQQTSLSELPQLKHQPTSYKNKHWSHYSKLISHRN